MPANPNQTVRIVIAPSGGLIIGTIVGTILIVKTTGFLKATKRGLRDLVKLIETTIQDHAYHQDQEQEQTALRIITPDETV